MEVKKFMKRGIAVNHLSSCQSLFSYANEAKNMRGVIKFYNEKADELMILKPDFPDFFRKNGSKTNGK